MDNFQQITGFIWSVADDVLRDDFKRSKYPDVILPFTVLRRIDCVLSPTKEQVFKRYDELKGEIENLDLILRRESGYAFYNTSRYDFGRLLDDPSNIQKNLIDYINGFSENMRDILDRFKIRNTIQTLHEKGSLYPLVQKFASDAVDLHPARVSNHQIGYIFEELIRKFNEQNNENPGEHFTPREVIKLMANLMLAGDEDMLAHNHIVKTVYDPACGTGGMLTITREHITSAINPNADIRLYGQETNDETYAVCKSDMLIKGDGRDADNIKPDSSFSRDGHPEMSFDYMISNPPYGKSWKKEEDFIRREYEQGSAGRFEAGLPRINDGQLLFLQHMLSKRVSPAEGGSRIAIVMNGSPLFTGDAGSGESEIRRWILENDWLEGIVALPDQLFYNTGISTYIWVLSNRKEERRRGKVQLIDATGYYVKMRRSLGDKRHEITDEQIQEITRLFSAFEESEHVKIFDTTAFGYRKITIERPLRLNFAVTPERMERLHLEKAFVNLATSRKKGDAGAEEIAEGRRMQEEILMFLRGIESDRIYRDREEFERVLDGLSLRAPVRRAILSALSERDESAKVCVDSKGRPEADPDLRDTENVPLGESVYDYFEREVKPHVPDAWIDEGYVDAKDGGVGRVGYEINFNRYFYTYTPPRPLEEIEAEIKSLEAEILEMVREMMG
ncbi:MAG: SAM-dependent DNA methyltransferase [Methanomicrobiales archaeon]|nr:SAM-dependent DNA methyltransferase [Methanomicrobiales archaeon]